MMKKNEFFLLLKQLEFSDTESKIYISLLRNNEKSITNLSRKLGIPRTTVFENLQNLKAKKLVREVLVNHKKILIAEEPYRLQSLLKNRQNRLESSLERLKEY